MTTVALVTMALVVAVLLPSTGATPELDCYRHGLESVTYGHRDTFVLHLGSSSSSSGELRNYECTCNGHTRGCDRLDCRLLIRTPTLSSPDPEIEIVEMTDDDEEEEEEELPSVVIFPQPSAGADSCFDDVTRQYVARGRRFTRSGTPAKGCTCPSEGAADLECVDLSCALAPSPNPPMPTNMDLRSCFDPWQNRVHPNGAVYNRTRVMSAYQSVTGTYKCTCSYGMTRCSAIDIPCCDSETGEYKGNGEKVSINYRGTKMLCTCRGGRSSFRDCQIVVPNAPATQAPTPAPTNAPSSGGNRVSVSRVGAGGNNGRGGSAGSGGGRYCVDRYSGKRHAQGSSYTQRRGGGEIFRCHCRLRNGYLKSLCSRAY